jgi:hypothetical protein
LFLTPWQDWNPGSSVKAKLKLLKKNIYSKFPQMLVDDCLFTGAGGLDYIVEGFDMLPR